MSWRSDSDDHNCSNRHHHRHHYHHHYVERDDSSYVYDPWNTFDPSSTMRMMMMIVVVDETRVVGRIRMEVVLVMRMIIQRMVVMDKMCWYQKTLVPVLVDH